MHATTITLQALSLALSVAVSHLSKICPHSCFGSAFIATLSVSPHPRRQLSLFFSPSLLFSFISHPPWISVNLVLCFSNQPVKHALQLRRAIFQLIKHIACQAIQTCTLTHTHNDMFICTPLADLLTLKQFPQQHEVAKNNVFSYGRG